MGIEDIDDAAKHFLTILFELSEGDATRQISMYQVGEDLGMTREEASKTAELLIGDGLAEIKTLSGGIGITEAAVLEFADKSGDSGNGTATVSALTMAPIIDVSGNLVIDTVITTIKHDLNELGLAFDAMSGVMADIKTIEVQLTSPSPKTAIIRECFISLQSWVEKSHHELIRDQIKSILG